MHRGKGTTPKALQTKQHDEKKSNNGVGESSFRVLYYGSASAGSVPFMWESQPGTPKHALTESSLPPLTPPPSYYQFCQKYNSPMQVINHHHSPKRSGFFRTIFFNSSKPNAPPPPSSLSSGSVSSSSSLSWRSTPMKFGSADDGGSPEHVAEDGGSPTSTLCFGGGFKRSYRVKSMKKQMLWFVRNGKA